MSMVAWDNKYSVKINIIDEQHKQLFEIINKIHILATTANPDKKNIGDVLTELIKYTQFHFTFEEKLLKQHKYPECDDHFQKHDKLINDLNQFYDKYEVGENVNTIELLNFAVDWLYVHILGCDMKYSNFLKEKGIDI